MFRKEFTVKSNILLKSSDKKKFLALVQEKFNILGDLNLTKTDELHLMRITTYSDNICEVYAVNKTPLIFIVNDKFYPTVYFLWKHPEALYQFVMHESILPKIQAGADLMLPGVLIEGEISVVKLGKLEKGVVCAVCLQNNRAAVAVGTTNISSLDMLECGMRGKGVQIVHVVGDFLWKMGPKDHLPNIPLEMPIINDTNEVETEKLESATINDETNAENNNLCNQLSSMDVETITMNQPTILEEFTQFFLITLKLYMKKTANHEPVLPIIATTFHSKYLLPVIEQADALERVSVQKTEFKRFNSFLQHMQDQGLLKVQEKQHGVREIVSVDLEHELFKTLPRDEVKRIKVPHTGPEEPSTKSQSAEFKELFSITAQVLPMVQKFDPSAKKADTIAAPDFRRLVTDYVRNAGLVDLITSGRTPTVRIDTLLSKVTGLKENETIQWSKLFEVLFSKMTPCYQFKFQDGQSGTKKGKPPCITLTTARRSGNKHVILINNLEAVGVDIVGFAKDLQIQMAASATVNHDPVPGSCAGPQIQVQGSNTNLVVKLLAEKYLVPKTMIKVQ